jgi:signal transduction histidine kinase
VLSDCLETLEPLMQQHAHRISASMPLAPLWLIADAMRLEQVFVNLLSNAAKYSGRGGQIELSLTIEGCEAVVRIRDNGVGIAAEFLPHVFELFTQAQVASGGAQAGLGIGLALVRTLVESHLGSVSAASAGLGTGSEFTVRLPLPPTGA